ncbi:unnamed protein product [Lupinus luteus]|uniref:TFIIS N-terminal domain-containing protein n=1 Tax=Lupinus luteus TaxID=3873 RepID=A0AAV1XZ65_LUPLU
MALEDFFTLSEMKDGLTTPSRVQELVSVMQKEKDCVAKNAGDATRQWSAVANTIAATENKDCLDLFIQLDGIWFINRWLQDAQTFALDANDNFIEESITAMLRAVEQLHLDGQKSASSGIHATVSNLLDHHSSRVQNRARVLFDSWKGGGNSDAESHDIAEVNNASGKSVREEGQPSITEVGNDNDHASGLAGGDKSLLRSPDSSPSERIDSVQIQSSGDASVKCEGIKERSPNYLASVPSSAQEVASLVEGLPLYAPGENALVETCNLSVPKQDSFEEQPDDVLLSDFTKKEPQEQNVDGPPEKLDAPEICSVSTKLEPEPVSMGASETKALEPVKETTLEHNVENDVGVCHKIVISDGPRTVISDRKSGVDHIIAASRVSEYDDDRPSNVLWDSSVSESELGKSEILEMSISGTEYVRTVKEGKGRISSEGENTSNASDSNKPGKGSRSPSIMDKKGSSDEFDNGTVDAIEVTRLIALEIEREVLSSSSEKIAQGGIRQPGSPDSVKKGDEPNLVPPKEDSSRESHSIEAFSDVEQRASISNNIEAEPECRPNMESLQVTEVAEDSGGNSEKRLCMFDLNEDGSDDMDVSVNAMSTTIPVVSASKPAPNPGLPGSPLQFEGTLGWKGSAATSAFCPASPRNSERNLSVGGSSDISKQRQDWLDFDLNVAEGDEEQTKPFAESSGPPPGQLPVEFSPKRSSRLELDLNSIGDDCDAQPSHQKMEGQLFLGRNGYWSPSPASSTSSMQPSVRNIDLNDRPCLQTDLVDQGPGKSSHFIDAFRRSKSDAPAISIFGTKVEIDRREEYVPPTLFLPNGKAIEPTIDLTMSRAGGILGIPSTVSYNHSSIFGYNGVASASTHPLSYSSAMYGSGGTIPYMVDSRGASVVPQVAAGSSSTVLPSYSQPPYIMNMTGTQLALNGAGPSHPPNLDLNSGFMIEGAGNRDALTARQFFFPGQGTMLQPSSSGVGGKRKEPDSGWESYPFHYKHPQPPWK